MIQLISGEPDYQTSLCLSGNHATHVHGPPARHARNCGSTWLGWHVCTRVNSSGVVNGAAKHRHSWQSHRLLVEKSHQYAVLIALKRTFDLAMPLPAQSALRCDSWMAGHRRGQ
jgi:hypothetical protein